MTRVLLAAALLVVCRAGAAEVPLSVQPMAAPKPALKYLLLPEVKELKPGNPVQWYIRCFQEQRNFFFGKEATAERAGYRAMRLADLPADKLLEYGHGALNQADWGARLDAPDWMVLERVQSEGAEFHMADLRPLRILGESLQVRLRARVAGKRYDTAVVTAKTMFGLARHLGECPVGDANRVGLSIAELALDTLEEMVQQPGCPNLYWALSDLPNPLVDLRKGMQGDRVRATADLGKLRDDPMVGQELADVISRLSGAIGHAREQVGRPPRNFRAVLKAAAEDAEKVRAARGRLVEAGLKESEAAKLSPTQVLLLDEKRAFEEAGDERLKLLSLPARHTAAPGGGMFADLLPDVAAARQGQAKLQRRIALLRHVEAIRMYAVHGKLPAKVADCGVPLPADPLTGEPFRYETSGATARLRGGPKDAADLDYLVTLRK
jgi:hypothetical protein